MVFPQTQTFLTIDFHHSTTFQIFFATNHCQFAISQIYSTDQESQTKTYGIHIFQEEIASSSLISHKICNISIICGIFTFFKSISIHKFSSHLSQSFIFLAGFHVT
jgi:hypothetical protein